MIQVADMREVMSKKEIIGPQQRNNRNVQCAWLGSGDSTANQEEKYARQCCETSNLLGEMWKGRELEQVVGQARLQQ